MDRLTAMPGHPPAAGAGWSLGTGPRPFNLNLGLFAIIFFTASWDVLLNLKVAGFSLRFCYLVIALLVVLNAPRLKTYALGSFEILGFPYLLAWTVFLLLFIPNTNFLSRNAGYMAWHLIHITFILVFVSSVNRYDTFTRLYRLYLLSYAAVALFGLFQLGMGIMGVNILVTQQWFAGLPRINAFSYEPSYFGTYMIMGFIQLFLLNINGQSLFSRRTMRFMTWTVTLCLFLSTSRMSAAVALLFILLNAGREMLRLVIAWKVRRAWASIIILLPACLGGVTYVAYENWDKVRFLFAGLGLTEGGDSYSTLGRFEHLVETWGIFQRSPLIGVSLGGIPSGRAEAEGIIVTTNEVAKNYEAVGVLVEILAASGLVGFCFFLAFLFVLFRKPLIQAGRLEAGDPQLARIIRGMVAAFAFEVLILCMNQNFNRPYIWIHIGMICLAYKMSRQVGAGGDIGAGPMARGQGQVAYER